MMRFDAIEEMLLDVLKAGGALQSMPPEVRQDIPEQPMQEPQMMQPDPPPPMETENEPPAADAAFFTPEQS
jgi:hypothetical protein